jgi:hypothetical protein
VPGLARPFSLPRSARWLALSRPWQLALSQRPTSLDPVVVAIPRTQLLSLIFFLDLLLFDPLDLIYVIMVNFRQEIVNAIWEDHQQYQANNYDFYVFVSMELCVCTDLCTFIFVRTYVHLCC